MRNAEQAGASLLARARRQRLDPAGALVMAAAGVAVERGTAGAAFAAARTLQDGALALLVAAAGEALSPRRRQEQLEEFARAVAPAERAAAFACCERFLALVDPAWGAALIERLLGEQGIRSHGALGLWLATRAEMRGIPVPDWVLEVGDARVLYRRQRAVDSIVSAVATGRLTDLCDRAFSPLTAGSAARLLLPSEAAAYLVAAARLDPARALVLAVALLQTHSPVDLLEALCIVADSAARAGLRGQVADLARRREFVLEQACWTEAAARCGVLQKADMVQLSEELVRRIEDELDPDRRIVAALPLLAALAHAGARDMLLALAARWRVPPPVLVDRLFHAQARRGATMLAAGELVAPLFAIPVEGWDQTYDCTAGWWLDCTANAETQLAACEDVLILTASEPAGFDAGVLTALWNDG